MIHQQKRIHITLVVGFVLLWNSGFIGAEYSLPYTGPFTLIFWRYLALMFILMTYLLVRGRSFRASWPAITTNTIVGVLAHGVWLGGVLLALSQQVPAGIIALVVALQPLTTGAFSGMVVNEPTPWHRWAGLIIGFGGVAITVLSRIDFSSPENIFGYLIPLASVLGITIATLMQRRMDISSNSYYMPLDKMLFYQSLGTALVFAIPAIVVEDLKTQWQPEFISSMLWLILGVSLGAYALMWLLIELLDATRVASLFYLGPPVTMLLAWIAFGDTLQKMDIIGLLVVFGGILVTQIPKTK